MNVFLIGSKELSVQVLECLISNKHRVKGVLTRDEEPGMQVWLNDLRHRSLAKTADHYRIPVYKNIHVNSNEFSEILTRENVDVGISVFWGQIIKERVFSIPKLGFFNLHTALLPRNRGSFPMAWAIINKEKYAGVTFHRISSGVDDGPIVAQQKVKISESDTGSSLYQKVTQAGIQLFQDVLPSLDNGSFDLQPQHESEASYNPRGYPFGGNINPLWSEEKKSRLTRALDFDPFAGVNPEPLPVLRGFDSPSVRIMIGFDCDRPRGSFIVSEKGKAMAEHNFKSLGFINQNLEGLGLPRTYFICGQFLESMAYKFGNNEVAQLFNPDSHLVEIADHTYSHQVMKKIDTRPDKVPISPKQASDEYKLNTQIFKQVFNTEKFIRRGFRTPLGHRGGISGENKLLDNLKREKVKYVSSDLRDENHSLHPKLYDHNGTIRQPYWYKNGILEIPSIGWQDTVFSKTSSTRLFETPPLEYEEVVNYYERLFKEAQLLAKKIGRDVFIGLVMHPFDNGIYNRNGAFFPDLQSRAAKCDATFHTYEDVANHFMNN